MAKKQPVSIAISAVVMTISEGALKTLLVKHDDSHWSIPTGIPDPTEKLHSSAVRIIKEYAGINVDYLEQLFTFGDRIPESGPRVIQIAYYGLVPSVLLRSDKLSDRRYINWFAEGEEPIMMPGNRTIISTARSRLRGKLAYSAVGFELLPELFTLAELQDLYEVILGKELDKRNFRKKINELGILEPTGEERSPRKGRGRPASLFRFKPEVFHSIETKGDIFPF